MTIKQKDLIKHLGVADSTFRRWRNDLGVPAAKEYTEETASLFVELSASLKAGMSLAEAIKQIRGEPEPDQQPNYRDALVNRYAPTIQKEAAFVGNAMAEVFDRMVFSSFMGQLASTKPTHFINGLKTVGLTGGSADQHLLEAELLMLDGSVDE